MKNAGHKNLIPSNMRSPEEQRRIASAAGKASVRARRAKRDFREAVLAAVGKDGVMESLVQALIDKAMSGDVRAFETLRDTSGQKPVERKELSGVDGAPIETESSLTVRFVRPEEK